MKTVLITLAFFLFGFQGSVFAGNDPMKGPWDRPEKGALQSNRETDHTSAGAFLISFYQKYISPVDGSNCPMYPSCSRYSLESFRKHGLFAGWVMTWDRLYRCGRDELRLSPTVMVAGQPKCFDPVENNDFWWSDEQ